MNLAGARHFSSALALAVALGCGAGCGPKVDAQFAQHSAAADELLRRGRPREAGNAWLATAQAAKDAHDRDEAVYRAAGCFERAGDTARAEGLLAGLAQGKGERAARAGFDRARLAAARDPAQGETLRLAALRAHPESGVAPHAFAEYLASVEAHAGAPAAVAACVALEPELAGTDLDEAARYACAGLSERLGDTRSALQGYLTTAERHPYPHGALWDDALSAAARCEVVLGDARAAVALLERLLAEREHAVGIGSYERAPYAQARFRIAELYRDALGDPARARREFRRVSDEHPTSLLGDDALFEEARLAVRMHDGGAACATLKLLDERYPDSRFTGCAGLLCAGAGLAERRCPTAVEATLVPEP